MEGSINIEKEDSVVNSGLEKENRVLKETLLNLRKELNKFNERPLVVCEVKNVFGDRAMIKLPNGNNFVVNVSKNLINKISASDLVLSEQRSLTIVDRLEKIKTHSVENFIIIEKPSIKWGDLGGLEDQIMEIKEVIELPLKKPELFKEVGIDPPKGILLYGPSGTGKTLLAKAVASSTNATFIEIVGSELNQKFIGEGAKLVKDIFQLAKEKGPSIIFIDEIDALAAERLDIGTSGEREVQRTFMQFLSEIDGFKSLDNVKIIASTNRIDILDPALLRPGRFDRLIEVPLPKAEAREDIFKIHMRDMSMDEDVKLHRLVKDTEGFSGADIKAVCTEAGYLAIRENRVKVYLSDFLKSIEKINGNDFEENSIMFG
ncbi:AAA family ATPase [Candidatus Woesearchaeota archaeon]|nr:AAA family ATPase [Candidatus Woesearchaeota archaeon]